MKLRDGELHGAPAEPRDAPDLVRLFSNPRVARTLVDNHPSRRVMEKLGFVYERDVEHANLPHGFYRLAPRAERRPGDSS